MCERSFSWLHSFTPGTGTCSPAYGTLVSTKLVPLLVGRPPGAAGGWGGGRVICRLQHAFWAFLFYLTERSASCCTRVNFMDSPQCAITCSLKKQMDEWHPEK